MASGLQYHIQAMRKPVTLLLWAAILMCGCSRLPQQKVTTKVAEATQTAYPLAVGTVLRVRLYHAIDVSKVRIGDSFIASLLASVNSNDQAVLPKGTVVR